MCLLWQSAPYCNHLVSLVAPTLLCMTCHALICQTVKQHCPIMEQAALDPPLLPALQGPPPPDVAELHRQVATAQANALSSAEALATAQQQVRHKQTVGSAFACPVQA